MTEVAERVAGVLQAALPDEEVNVGWPDDDPQKLDRSLWVTVAGGPPPIAETGTGLYLEQPTVQVIARDSPFARYASTKALADAARAALRGTPDAESTEFMPLGGVIPMGRDNSNRPRMSFNIRVTHME